MMRELQISPVGTEAELSEFICFPWQVYRDDPYWVPPLISERLTFLDASKNPFFEHARAEYFLARRDGKTVGTIGAFTNDRYNEFHGINTGFFGFFEVLDDPEAASALLETAEKWSAGRGHTAILGPAQFSTNDECGLLIDGFDDRPRILMTYNPPRYKTYLEERGYSKAMDLWAYSLDLKDFQGGLAIPPKLVRVAEKVAARGKLRIRNVDMKHFDEELDRVKRIYNKSWERNWGFVPMTEPEFDRLGEQMKPFLDPDLVVVVEHEGEAVGFGLTVPDLNQPLLKAYPKPGRPEALTMARLLWNWKVRGNVDWLRVIALGVLPEFRAQGVDALMYLETARRALPKGYKYAEMSWILENNVMMNRAIRALGGRVYKTYRMYEKPV
jgi:GNAT superfamily N-acetyltransferase